MSNKKSVDKTTVVVVAVCVILLFSWNYIFGPNGLDWLPQPEPQKQENIEKSAETSASAKTSIEKSDSKSEAVKTGKINTDKKTSDVVQSKPSIVKSDLSIKEWEDKYPDAVATSPDSLYTLKINPAKGAVDSITLNKISDSDKSAKVVLAKDLDPAALTVEQPKNKWTLINVKQPVKTDGSITLTRQLQNENGQSFNIIQKWTLGKNYATSYDVTIKNDSPQVLNMRELYFYIGAIASAEYISGDHPRMGMESRTIDALLSEKNELITVKAGSSTFLNEPVQFMPVKWISTSDAYFVYILKVAGKDSIINGGNYIYTDNVVDQDNKEKENISEIGAAAREQSISIKPNEEQTWSFAYYSGPKDIMLLKGFAPQADNIVHLMSWPVFRTIAKWFLFALIWLKDICGSFGIAIILLTIIVKLIFWPLTHKSNMSMKRMQKIQPMVKELREKYKDDKQKLNQATMELYKREKVNPLGGCLPMLIQIPVLIALYYTLGGAFEIRHASFLWAADLTKPDTVAHVFGLAINPFAILMAITMLIQQKMTPTATDPAQAKMMMLMPLIMLIFLYMLPSGLTLYWTVSQVITIIQLLYNKYFSKDENDKKNNNSKAQKKKAVA